MTKRDDQAIKKTPRSRSALSMLSFKKLTAASIKEWVLGTIGRFNNPYCAPFILSPNESDRQISEWRTFLNSRRIVSSMLIVYI